jgi:hypothetical protein
METVKYTILQRSKSKALKLVDNTQLSLF